jgi:transposase
MKIAVLCGRNVWECHAELHEALGDCAIPYGTAARWVQAFKTGRVSTANIHHSGHAVSIQTDMCVAIIEQCMKEDRRWTVKELAELQSDSQTEVDIMQETICRQGGHFNSSLV